MKFASFAALALTATQAAKMKVKQSPQPATQQLAQAQKPPMSYSNIMESVKSLEKAYEFHKNEEKLLNEINTELRQYWDEATVEKKLIQDDSKQTSSAQAANTQQAKAQIPMKQQAQVQIASKDQHQAMSPSAPVAKPIPDM